MPTDNRHIALAALGVLALFGLVAVLRSGRRQARDAAAAVHTGVAAVNLAGRSLATAVVIVGVQWLVVTRVDTGSAWFWVVLVVPALVASHTLTRAFTLAPTVVHRRRGGRY